MNVAALYDIHGNLPALRAVLAEVARERPSLVVVGGDVAAGPLPEATVDALLDAGWILRWVMGDTDRAVADGAGPVAAWAAERLRPEQAQLLETFEPGVSAGAVRFCHGSPRADAEPLTPATPDARLAAACAGVRERLVVCGHTRRQFDRRVDGRRVVNAGSVGLPWEGDPAARWLLLRDGTPELRRTAYDVDAALRELRAGGAPWVDALVRDSLVDPVDPDARTAELEAGA